MRRSIARSSCFLFAILLLAACGQTGSDSSTPSPFPELEGTATPGATPTTVPNADGLRDIEWILATIEGEPPISDSRVTLSLTDEGAGGYGGCNWYNGQYSLDDDRLRFNDMMSTARGCVPNELGTQEYRYTTLLQETERFQLQDMQLELLNAEGVATLVFIRREALVIDPADLIGTTWQLASYENISAAISPALLTFEDGSGFSTRDGCYNYSGTYTAAADRLTITSITPMAHACLQPGSVQHGSASLSNVLDGVATYRISDDTWQLQLHHRDGTIATFLRVTDLPPVSAWSVTWTLESILIEGSAQPLIEGAGITLHIPNPSLQLNESQSVSGTSGCNTFQASLTVGVDTLAFSNVVATDMACPEPAGIMDQEQRFLELLREVSRHTIVDDYTLHLITDDGTTLAFRYGS